MLECGRELFIHAYKIDRRMKNKKFLTLPHRFFSTTTFFHAVKGFFFFYINSKIIFFLL